MSWRDISSAPRDRYFLACALPERAEENLHKAIFGSYSRSDNRHLIVARIRPKQRKGRVFASVTGQPFWASHWMELPEMPEDACND